MPEKETTYITERGIAYITTPICVIVILLAAFYFLALSEFLKLETTLQKTATEVTLACHESCRWRQGQEQSCIDELKDTFLEAQDELFPGQRSGIVVSFFEKSGSTFTELARSQNVNSIASSKVASPASGRDFTQQFNDAERRTGLPICVVEIFAAPRFEQFLLLRSGYAIDYR